jgi:hypothetical protein
MLLSNSSFSLLCSLSKIHFTLKKREADNFSFEKNRITIINEPQIPKVLRMSHCSAAESAKNLSRKEIKSEKIRKKAIKRVSARLRGKGIMLSIGNDEGFSAVEVIIFIFFYFFPFFLWEYYYTILKLKKTSKFSLQKKDFMYFH